MYVCEFVTHDASFTVAVLSLFNVFRVEGTFFCPQKGAITHFVWREAVTVFTS